MRNIFLYTVILCLMFSVAAFSQDTSHSCVIKQINITGNSITKRNIILREMSVNEGSVINKDSSVILIEQNRLQLLNSTLFTIVTITPSVINADTIIWDVYVKERWYILPKPVFNLADRNFNVWWTDQNRDLRRINAGLTLINNNFRGNMERLSIGIQAGYTQKLSVEYFKPYIDKGQQHGIGAFFSISRSRELYYTTDKNKQQFLYQPIGYIVNNYEAGLNYAYRPAFPTHHRMQLSYHQSNISDTVAILNNNYFDNHQSKLQYLELQYRIDLNHVDNWNYPLRGFKMVSQANARVGIQGLNYMLLLKTEAGYYHRIAPKWYGAAICRGRVSTQEDQPYIFRSALGTKTDYVRGYELYMIDGSHFFVFRTDLKYELLNKTLFSLSFKHLPVLPLRIYPKFFADYGYVHDRYPGNSILSNRPLYSMGLGVDFVLAYDIKIRFEYALNHLGEKGLFLHTNAE